MTPRAPYDLYLFCIRPNDHVDFELDRCELIAEMDSVDALMFRSRLNPEIRSIMLKMPLGTSSEKAVEAFYAMSREERYALYLRAKNLA